MSGGEDNKADSPRNDGGNRAYKVFSKISGTGKSNHGGPDKRKPGITGEIRKDQYSDKNTTQQKEKNIDCLAIKQSDSSPVDSFVCK